MSRTIKRKARHQYVFIVQWLTPVKRIAMHGAFLSQPSASAWAQTVREGRTFEVIPLKLHSEKKT